MKETTKVKCQFVSCGKVTEAECTVVLKTEDDRKALDLAMDGRDFEYNFHILEKPFFVKPKDIVPRAGYRSILNNGENCMAVRCTDGWLVVNAGDVEKMYNYVDVTFQPDEPFCNALSDFSAYIEEEVEKGELSVRVWSDTNSEDYTHKIILKENKNDAGRIK